MTIMKNEFPNGMQSTADTSNPGSRFTITVTHPLSGQSTPLEVDPEHTLAEIAEVCAKHFGTKLLSPDALAGTYHFMNDRTGRSADTDFDMMLTVSEFGLRPGDTLIVYDDASNA